LLSVKTNALEHCAILGEFPEVLREFLIDADKKVKKNYLRIMHEVYSKSDFQTAVSFAIQMVNKYVIEYEKILSCFSLYNL